MEVRYETVVADVEEPNSAKAVFRMAATYESWSFDKRQIEDMIAGNREVDGVEFDEGELRRGLDAIHSLAP